MRAWRWSSAGREPELEYVPDPNVKGSDEVVINLDFSSLNHRDAWISQGKYPNIQWPCTLGSDGIGYFGNDQVLINPGKFWGSDEKFQSEDYQILGMPDPGTFADKVLVLKQQIYPIPKHLALEEAAAIPLAGVTAYRTLMVKGKPEPHHRVLITGIGGGVALWALQFALSLSCEVFVMSGSDDKINKAKALGAAGGVNLNMQGWDKTLIKMAGGFDIIIDSIMGDTLPSLIKLTRPGGKICFYGASAGITDQFSPHSIFWKQIELLGSTMGSDLDFKSMLGHIDQHKIKPVIDKVLPFTKLPEAMARMKERQQFGKIVINHHE